MHASSLLDIFNVCLRLQQYSSARDHYYITIIIKYNRRGGARKEYEKGVREKISMFNLLVIAFGVDGSCFSREKLIKFRNGLPADRDSIPSPIFCISQNRMPVTMTLITLIMEQNGLGGWWLGVGFSSRIQCLSRSIQIEKKARGRSLRARPGCPPPPGSRTPTIRSSYPGENIQIATLSQCERRLLPNPFDRIQWASIFKFIWRRFLFLQPFLARPSPVLLSSLSLSRSLLFAFFPATETVTRNRCELPGVGKGTGKKEFASRSFFFLLQPSILAV